MQSGLGDVVEDLQDVVLKLYLRYKLEEVEAWPNGVDYSRLAHQILYILADLLEDVQTLQQTRTALDLISSPALLRLSELDYQPFGHDCHHLHYVLHWQLVHLHIYYRLHHIQQLKRTRSGYFTDQKTPNIVAESQLNTGFKEVQRTVTE